MEKGEVPRPRAQRCLLAHDVNNDLNVILGHCELLDSLGKDHEVAKHLRLIREAAWHLAGIAARTCPLAGILRS